MREPRRHLDRLYMRGVDAQARRLLESMLRRSAMGEIRAKALLQNEGDVMLWEEKRLGRRKVRAIEIDAVVDTGAVMSLLPQEAVEKLGLHPIGKTVVSLADDRKIELLRVGGIRLTVADRTMTMDCLVGPPGCEPLIGQLVMESLDLIADPGRRTLTPRPESPFAPTLKMKKSCPEFSPSLR